MKLHIDFLVFEYEVRAETGQNATLRRAVAPFKPDTGIAGEIEGLFAQLKPLLHFFAFVRQLTLKGILALQEALLERLVFVQRDDASIGVFRRGVFQEQSIKLTLCSFQLFTLVFHYHLARLCFTRANFMQIANSPILETLGDSQRIQQLKHLTIQLFQLNRTFRTARILFLRTVVVHIMVHVPVLITLHLWLCGNTATARRASHQTTSKSHVVMCLRACRVFSAEKCLHSVKLPPFNHRFVFARLIG